jgi:lipoprotein-releasing system permease protein
VLAPLATALRLTGRDGQVSRIELLPSEPGGSSFREAAFREAIEARLGPGLKLRSRREKNALIHATHRAEKWITFSILAFIVVVAGFNILASLTLLLIEKKRDISTLWAMGMTPKAIRQIFSWQGAMINAIGAGIGLALGIGLVLAQSRYGFVQFEGAMVPAYPVELRWGDVAMVLGLVMAVGVTFSIGMVQYLVRRQELGPYAKAKSATRV